MREHFRKRGWVYFLASGFAVGVVTCLLTDIQNFSFDPTGGIEFSTRDPNDVENFEAVWAADDRRAILMGLLAEQGIFAPGDERVVNAIQNLCDPIPQDPLDAYLSAARECAEQQVPSALRQLAQQQLPPFHPSGRVVSIGVPAPADQPSVGRANTCQNGDWYGRQVLLINSLNGRQITVVATGHYGQGICGPLVGTADLQLNEADAFTIFDGPLDKFEEAVAVIVS